MVFARALLPLGLIALAASTASADITYLAQNRELYAGAGFSGPTTSQSLTAPDFGRWVESLIVDVMTVPYPGGGTARQDSSLDPTVISLITNASASDGAMTGVGTARSTAIIAFTLTTSSPFRLRGAWTVTGHPTQSIREAFVSLTSATGTIFESAYDPLSGPSSATFDTTGTLTPGDYVFMVESDTTSRLNPGFGFSIAEATGILSIPTPASLAAMGLGLLMQRRRR